MILVIRVKEKKVKSKINNRNNREQSKTKFWDNSNELKKLIVIFVIVVVIFAIFYAITLVIKDNRTSQPKEDNSVAVIQYDEIIVGEILNQNKEAYFVLATEEDDDDLSSYQSYIDSYGTKEGALKVYKVNLNSAFNKKYIGEESNFAFDQLSEIRFNKATLLKIENGEIIEYYEGTDEITEYLKELMA